MKNVILIVFITFISGVNFVGSLYSAEKKEKLDSKKIMEGLSEESRETMQMVFTFLNPTIERCRPAIIKDRDVPYKINESQAPYFACMLAGFKNVVLMEPGDGDDVLMNSGVWRNRLPSLFRERNISLIEIPGNGSPSSQLLYSPQGRIYASLYLRRYAGEIDKDMHEDANSYLRGHLIGYSDDDIEAFYVKRSTVKFGDPDAGRAQFETDKKLAHAWIEKNKKEVEANLQKES